MVPKISVVMPVYNASDFLVEAIDSVLNQTWTDFELIIVDDGSTDNSSAIVRSYPDKRIVFIQNSHQYIESLNMGMNRAQGKYIARMDSDDLMRPERLQVQYEFMEAHPEIGVCGSWFKIFGTYEEEYKVLSDMPELVSCLLVGNSLCHPSTMIRKSELEALSVEGKAGMYRTEYIYAEDYKLWCELVMNGTQIALIPRVLLDYRTSDKQVTKQHYHDLSVCTRKIQREFLKYVTNTIIDEQPAYFDLVNGLIKLYNQDLLKFQPMMQLLKSVYLNFLRNQGSGVVKVASSTTSLSK